MNDDQKAVLDFIEEQAVNLPLHRRVRVYRGLGDMMPNHEFRRLFFQRARVLEQADALCAELKLDWPAQANQKTRSKK